MQNRFMGEAQRKMTTFLTAEWRKLLMANYVVEERLISPYVPEGTVLDLYQGRCYLSIVGFLFQNTRLRGIRVPFHVEFEEVNLRFYVRRGDRRGVVFIREIVPRRALQLVASTFYGEPYVTAPMRHQWTRSDQDLAEWKTDGHWQSIEARTTPNANPVPLGSEEEFITEHYWGYTARRGGRTSEYEVVHPRWDMYDVLSYSVDVDFSLVYSERFACLNAMQPHSVLLAEGSEVMVRSGLRIDAAQMPSAAD
jgi:uncharacterized protein YqjF (DUF2071 family)